MNISRCTLYNWFEQDILPYDVLVKIGLYINYDFSQDFPDIFYVDTDSKVKSQVLDTRPGNAGDADYWMRKYIVLLEKYNDCLMSGEKTTQKIF